MSAILEFPPTSVPTALSWTKDTTDTIAGLSSTTYVKYKTTLSNQTYGNGQYVAWANSVYGYSSNSSFGSNELPPSGAFDMTALTTGQNGWCTATTDTYINSADSGTPAILYLKCPNAFVLKSYSLQARTDATLYAQVPISWKMYGSMDGNYWTLIDTQSGQSNFTTGSTATYTLTNITPYSYYQMSVLRNQSGTATQACIAELRYYGIPYPIATQTGNLEFPPTSVAAGGSWTKDTNDTITGIGSNTYVRYKNTLSNLSYGNGQYIAWANSVYGYSNSASYGSNEWPVSGAFDKLPGTTGTYDGWATNEGTYTNATDASTPVLLYLTSPQSFALRSYSIQARTDLYVLQTPSSWKLYGSLNGALDSSSVLLDTQTSQTSWSLSETRTFYVNNVFPYTTYILQILRNNNASSDYISIGELRYFGTLTLPTEGAVLEFPPPMAVGIGNAWTKDTGDTVAGVGGQSGSNLAKYKYVVPATHPYGSGEYQAYANQIYSYSASNAYGTNEFPASGAFDKNDCNYSVVSTTSTSGWSSSDTLTNTGDATTPVELTLKLPVKVFLIQYNIRSRIDQTTTNPIKWRVYGSQDGSTWSLVDYVPSFATTWTAGMEAAFPCYTIVPYQYYKLSILRVNSSSSVVAIGEWRLSGIMNSVTISTSQQAILEYPPPVSVPVGYQWTKDLTDTMVGIGGTSYCKYKCTLASTSPYGQGQYVAWANTVSGYTAASTYGASEWAPSGCFDKTYNITTQLLDSWSTNETTWTNAADAATSADLYIKLPSNILIVAYALFSRNDDVTSTGSTSYPTKWTLYGSRDGINWSVVDVRSNEISSAMTICGQRFYTVSVNMGSFDYYKLSIWRNNNASGQAVQLNELRLFGSPETSTTNLEILEYPPQSIGAGNTWTKDSTDTFNGLSKTTYYRYKYTMSNAAYGNGQYIAWANSIYQYSASTSYGSDEWPPSGAFDKRPAYTNQYGGWQLNLVDATLTSTSDMTDPPELYIQLPNTVVLKYYSIQARTDGISPQLPLKFEVYGSTDGSTWTRIDTRNNETNWGSGEERKYIIDRGVNIAYNYFKMRFYRNNSTTATVVSIGEWRLFGCPQDAERSYEFPPPVAIGAASNWVMDTTDQVTSIDSQTYYRYKNYVPSSHPYGSGEYDAWANTIQNTSTWPVSGLFDPSIASYSSYCSYLTTYTNSADASPAPQIFLRLPLQISLRSYVIMARPDSNPNNTTQTPSKWNLYGSNDELVWMLLDSRTTETGWSVAEQRGYICNSGNQTSYFKTFMITLYRNNASSATNFVFGKWRLFGVPNTSTTAITTNVSYKTSMKDVHYVPDNIYAVTELAGSSGLIGWYKGETWTGTVWTDVSGAGNHATTTQGTISVATWPGNGMKYLYGPTTAGIQFPTAILPTTYTLFHVARYNGTNKQRIFDGIAQNWLSGFTAGMAGLAYHGTTAGWITQSASDVFGTAWVVSTDQNNLYRGQGSNLTSGTPTTGINDRLSVNYGVSALRSDWAVAEVMVFNTTLTTAQITVVETYLLNKWYNPLSIQSSPAGSMLMPRWYKYANDVQSMPGLVGWYKGDSWRNGTWFDASGSGNHATTTRGTINVAPIPEKNGLLYLWGGVGDGILFPSAILPTTYTLFHVARYNGINKNRIIDGVATNWFSGFSYSYNTTIAGGCAGTAYHGSLMMTYVDFHGRDWVISSDQKNLYRSNGVLRGGASPYATGASDNISVNYGLSASYSDWAVAEVIVFERELNTNAITYIEQYLSEKYGIERTVPVPNAVSLANAKSTWRYNNTDITNYLTLSKDATRTGATVSLTTANTAMSYGCGVFPFTHYAPGGTYTIESEILVNSTDTTLTKNALWLGIGGTFPTNRYSWEYDQTGGYNMAITLNSDHGATDAANAYDVMATSFSTYTQTPATAGLVVYYNFASVSAGTVTNAITPGTNNGTLTGTYTVLTNCPLGTGIRVQSQDFGCALATPISTATVSGACWYYLDSFNSNGYSGIFSHNLGNFHHIIIQASTRQIGFFYQNITYFTSSGIALTPGKWYHLAFTVSGSNYRLYINGAFVWSSSGFFDNTNPSCSLGLVGNTTTSSPPYAPYGILADVRIYNTQLTDQAILDIYTKTASFQQAMVARQPLNVAELIVPPVPLTSDGTNVISTGTYGNGLYTCSASTEYTGIAGMYIYAAFDQNMNTYWHSTLGNYNTSTGVFTGATTTTINGTSYLGEWLQLQLPAKLRLVKFTITPRQDSSLYQLRAPNVFYIAGSNDGSTWILISSYSGIGDWTVSARTFPVNCSLGYVYYRCVINTVGNTGQSSANRNCANISWDIYGHFDNVSNTTYTQQVVLVPPSVLTSNSTSLSSAAYAPGTYTVSASTTYDGTRLPWKAFGFFVDTTNAGNYWHSADSVYTATTGAYAGAVSTTISGSAFTGEWLQIQLPYNLKLYRYEIMARQDMWLVRSPNVFKVAGSVDGTNWYLVDSQSGVGDWTTSIKNFVPNSMVPYAYYRLVANVVGNTGQSVSRTAVNIAQWNLYGYSENTGWRVVRQYVDLNKRRFRTTVPSQGIDVSTDIPVSYLTNTGTQLGFAARTDTHYGNFQLRFCKIFSGWQEIPPLHLPYIDLDATNLTRLQPGEQIGLWRNSGLEGGVGDAVAYTDGTVKPTYQIDAMGQPYVHFERSAMQYMMVPGTLRFSFRAEDMTPIGGMTVVAVMRFSPSAGNDERIIDFSNKVASSAYGNNVIMCRNGTTQNLLLSMLTDTAIYAQGQTGGLIDTHWHVYVMRIYNTPTASMADAWLDGVKSACTQSPSGVMTKHTTTYNYIGKSTWTSNGDAYLQGDMRELLVYRTPLSDETVGTVTAHLQSKWKLWRTTKMCVCHFDANYLGTVANVAVGSNVATWKNLGDDNTITDATCASAWLVYPPAVLTGNTTVISGQTYGNGTYVVAQTSIATGGQVYNAFDGNQATAAMTNFNSPYSYDGTAGTYITPTNSTVMSGTTYYGEYFTILLPTSIVLTRYDLYPVSTASQYPYRSPNTWFLGGSSDGTTWYLLDSQAGIQWTSTASQSFSIASNTTPYKYYRILTTVVGNTGVLTRNDCQIGEWKLYTTNTSKLRQVNGYYHLEFDRTYSQYLYLNATLDFSAFNTGTTPTNGFTAVVLAQFSGTAGSYERLFDFGNGAPSDNIILARSGTGSQVYFTIFNSTSTQPFAGANSIGLTIDMTQWHIYTMTFTNASASTLNFYVDGQLVPITNNTSSTYVTNKWLGTNYIGRSAYSADSYLTGNIREFIVFRTALATTDLATLHTSLIKKWGLTDTPPTPPLYKMCHFDANDLTATLAPGASISSWTNKANDSMVFPPAAMTADTTSLASASWGIGTYVASASSELGATNAEYAYKAFDKNYYSASNAVATTQWTSATASYSTTGAYTGAYSTTMSATAYTGEWIQLQMPQNIILKYYTVNVNLARYPVSLYLGGSADGSTWTLLDTRTGLSWGSSEYTKSFTVSTTTAYNYFRIVIGSLLTGASANYANMGQIDFFGDQEGIWPPAAMSADTTAISGQNYGNGTFVALASSEIDGTRQAWRAFGQAVGTGTDLGVYWSSGSNLYNDTTGVYTGTASTVVGGVAYTGEWVQLQSPVPFKMTRYSITPRQDGTYYASRSPDTYYIAGSLDGSTWTLLGSGSGVVWTTSAVAVSTNITSYYAFYRLIAASTGNTGTTSGQNCVNINLWNIYGVVPFTNYQPSVFNAVQSTTGWQPTLQQDDGLYYVNFSRASNQYLYMSPTSLDFNSFANNATAQNGLTAIVVGRMTSAGNYERFFDFSNGSTNQDSIDLLRNGLTSQLYFQSNTGTTAHFYCSWPSGSLDGNWHIYTIVITNAASPSYQLYQDGNLVANSTNGTSFPNRYLTASKAIGHPSDGSANLNGGIRELILYKQPLQGGDLANIHWNLIKKWRICSTASLTNDVFMSNKILHFDANDLVHSFNLTTGSTITTWRNLGTDGARLDATAYGSPTLQQENGYWHVHFVKSSSQYFRVVGSLPFAHLQDADGNFTGGITVTCVFRMTTTGTGALGRVLNLSTGNAATTTNANQISLSRNGLNDGYFGSMTNAFNAQNSCQTNFAQAIGTWHIVTFTALNSIAPVMNLYVDGCKIATTNVTTGGGMNNRTTTYNYIGNSPNSELLDGDIRELQVYRTCLSASEINMLHSQLASKWGMGQQGNALQRYPPNMTGDTTTYKGLTYTAYATSERTTALQAWYVFDGIPDNQNSSYNTSWQSGDSCYDSNGNALSTPALGSPDDGYGGQWVQISLPFGIYINYYQMGGDAYQWRIYGNTSSGMSTNGWVLLDDRTRATAVWSDVSNYQVPNSANLGNAYYAFAMKIKKSATAPGFGRAAMHTLAYYGTPATTLTTVPTWTAPDTYGWNMLYDLTQSSRDSSGNIMYVQNNASAYTNPFTRVAYYMQNNMGNGATTYWAFVSFDAWSANATTYRIPSATDPFTIQSQPLANVTVISNHPQVTARSGATGLMNAWPYSYTTGSGQSVYNYLNTSSGGTSNGYGTLQIYDMTTTYPVFCWNRHQYGYTPDCGFGNNDSNNINYAGSGTNPNWTLVGNGYYNWRLRIMVK